MKWKNRQGSIYFQNRVSGTPKGGTPKARLQEKRDREYRFSVLISPLEAKDNPILRKTREGLKKMLRASRGKHYTPTNRINMK